MKKNAINLLLFALGVIIIILVVPLLFKGNNEVEEEKGKYLVLNDETKAYEPITNYLPE